MNFSIGRSGKLRKQLTEHQRKKVDRLGLAVTQGQSDRLTGCGMFPQVFIIAGGTIGMICYRISYLRCPAAADQRSLQEMY